MPFSPEFRLLLLCAKPHLAPVEEKELDLLIEICEWPQLEKAAKRHNVEALVFSSLENDRRKMPTEVWQRLREEYLLNARNNLALAAELLRIHKLFQQHALTFLPFKGPALATSAYGSLVLRRSVDLDLLLPQQEIKQAAKVLINNGYVGLGDWLERVPKELLKYRGEYQLAKDDILLELQWRLAPSYYALDFDIAAMSQRAKPAPLSGEEIPMLAPEDHLLLLCAHGWKELWGRLSWVADIAHLLATYPQLDWHAVLQRAQAAHTTRLTLVGLNLAKELFDSPLPTSVTTAIISDARVRRLTNEAIERLQAETALEPTPRQLLAYRERLADRLRFAFGLAVNPTENEWALTKSSSAFQHRILRIKRVTAIALERKE